MTATATRKVQRDGVQFASTRYISPVLAAYVGEQVTVRYNPRDVGEIRVYFNNEYLCRAIAPELAAEYVSLAELRAARSTRRRELKHQLRQRRSLADALPTDTRYTPINPPDTPELEELTEQDHPINTEPTPTPPPVEATPRRNRLRLYATD